ncbi:MAG: insulinase family protein [Myxococcales bacterium]|nr:insulinase family protein [Myxococcales bacterium]
MRRATRHVVAMAAVVAVVAVGCARWAREPRFGPLVAGPRPERFAVDLRVRTLANGAQLALATIPGASDVTIDVRYRVGAADDPAGRRGLAHLAEHASFLLGRDEAHPGLGDALAALALRHGARTTTARTHYAARVPAAALAAALALEARRMAGCAALPAAEFARERAVVLAEHDQRATPFTAALTDVLIAAYGADHPYAQPLDGPELLDATPAEACRFLRERYAPGAAIVVVTGALPPDALALVERTIGAVPARPVYAPRPIPAAAAPGPTVTRAAPVAWPTVLVAMPLPARGSPIARGADAVRERLGDALAVIAQAQPWAIGATVLELGGPQAPTLVAALEVASPAHVDDARAAVQDALATVQAALRADVDAGHPPRALAPLMAWDDDDRRGAWIADALDDGRAAWLAGGDLLAEDGAAWPSQLDAASGFATVDRAQLVVLTPAAGTASATVAAVAPLAQHSQVPWREAVDPARADRPAAPPPGATAPPVERYQLPNGLTVMLAPDPASPLVDARLVFPVGAAHEAGAPPGVATAAALLLRPDRDGVYAPTVLPRVTFATTRGTALTNLVDEATTTFAARGLAVWADWHVWYLAWLLDQGRYNHADVARMHAVAHAERARAPATGATAATIGDRALRARLFGADHPYARPGRPIADALAALTDRDLERWRRARYRPTGATLIVSGGFTPAAMRAEIDALFGPWPASTPPTAPAIPPAAPEPGPAWLAVDAPTAIQAELTIGFAASSDPVADGAARAVLLAMLDDGLRDLRDGMGASYGVDVAYVDAGAGPTLVIRGAVGEAQAGAALARVLTTIAALRDGADAQRAAFVRGRQRALDHAAAGRRGAIAAADHLVELARRGLGPDHDAALLTRLAVTTPADVAALAARDLTAARMAVQVRARAAVADAAFAALRVVPTHVR